ncbi:adenylosuccinate lyase [Spiroplasma tabanidicola]|uniref:Adenylosuccinate lyase n=1 Tax=Spiroplasma tabanidicola TaxID=324079 RepID=A0A6I6CA67_9MOLU|nr:adenylosuccinate lyase [Spiroplasma tabanidicola]QGS52446.1 adenylosuccinate lyase [Spiroplasma tabanidicola]
MINRYSIKEVEKIWDEKNRLEIWLDVEKFVVDAWRELGIVSKEETNLVYKNAKIDVERMLEIEKETKHDVVAFTRAVSETLGAEKKWIHLGLTSTDVVDTAQNKMIQMSNDLVQEAIEKLLEAVLEKANENRKQIIMGRSHGMWGEPTSLGLKFLLWFDEIKRQEERFKLARKQIEVAKISGSMGNYANIEMEVEEFVAKKMNLNVDNISTQVTQRDRHAFLISVLSNLASTLEKIGIEIRHFQRSEVNEVCEGFDKGQKGSSSMPHKKNPISSENVSGLARYIRSFVTMGYENNLLWHERDISHSSNERLMLPDVYNIMVYILNRMTNTIKNLVVNKENIENHIKEANNLFFSQRVLTYILMKYNYSREEVYDFIQACTLEAQKTGTDFKKALKDKGILNFIKSENEFDQLFNIQFFLRNVDKIFERVLKENGRKN